MIVTKTTAASAVTLAFLELSHALAYRSTGVQWQACDPIEFNSTVTLECSTLLVPLDYTAPNSTETLALNLIRTPAITQPSKGSILFNFGGPGEPGRSSFSALAAELLPLTGGTFDLVAFDVRGTLDTLELNCFVNEVQEFAFLDAWGKTSNSSDVAAASLWARAGVDSNLCYNNAQANGSLVSTAFTARDLISIVDALDEDGLLRYWGFSYGTTLGFTVAAMFPDRIDMMILDGVQNPQEYYHALGDFQEWTDTDSTFRQIFETCIAAGENCTLNALNATADELVDATWALLDLLKTNPVPLGDVVLDYSAAKNDIFNALYDPKDWPDLADTLVGLLGANATQLMALSDSTADLVSTDPVVIEINLSMQISVMAIHCSDRAARAGTLGEFLPALEELYSISSIYGDGTDLINFHCAQWKIEPKERYEGGFDVATPNPVLFIGNTWDPYTPLVSAYNVSAGFNGSVVLEVQGYGHTSLAAPSKCTLEKTVAYWANTTLPANGTVCELDAIPYSNETWADVFAAAGWSYTSGYSTS
ncbi:peptidase S33, tripeptidyl-peptidase [Xylariales sp. PMI_506]|nr:peptidase S33, tripeptidyl-peptidase [Xylariales sp. PMI_506]